MFKHLLILTMLMGLLVGCATQPADDEPPVAEVGYYRSFAGYHMPYRPQGQISKEEALQQDSYYVGWHGDTGKLMWFEKYLHGQRLFRVDYTYDDNGNLKRAVSERANGERSTRDYDRKGKPLD